MILRFCLGLSFFVFALQAAKAADLTFQATGETAVCERLLDADLAGNYVVTNLKSAKSTLVELRRMGAPDVYGLSTSILNLTRHGDLLAERNQPGWEVGDNLNSRVNVLSMKRADDQVSFHFEDATELTGKSFNALPVTEPRGLTGNVLKPDSFTVHFNEIDSDIRFTRLDLNHQLTAVLSRQLKSVLATRIDATGGEGDGNILLLAEMNRPMTEAEASQFFGTANTVSLDGDDPGERYYRFVVPRRLYFLLENIGVWMRNPDVARMDVLPTQVLGNRIGQRITERGRAVTSPAPQTPVSAPATPAPAPAFRREVAPRSASTASSELKTEQKTEQKENDDALSELEAELARSLRGDLTDSKPDQE